MNDQKRSVTELGDPSRPHGEAGKEMLRMAVAKFGLSGRAYDRILKLSRTIADLDGVEQIQSKHIAQCLQYRTVVENKD